MRTARRTTAATALVLATAGGLLTTAPAAEAAVSCASPLFKREYFANTTLTGAPRRTDCDSAVNEHWTGAPATGLPRDRFGVRWTLTRDFGSGGPFALSVQARDGVRVYLDGVRKYDAWSDLTAVRKGTVNLSVPKGRHTLRIDFVNWTGPADVTFTYAPRTSATVDKVKPLAPAGFGVAHDRATARTKLSWVRNKEMDLGGYRVYRRLAGQPFPARPLAVTTGAAYTDATPATGQTFLYELRAHDRAGNESPGTSDLAVTTADRTAPAAPTAPRATVAAGAVKVGWQAVTGADRYRVLRAPGTSGPWTTAVDRVTAVSWQDTGADIRKQWYYRIAAIDAAGNVSAPSATGTTGAPDTTAPQPVAGIAGQGTTAGNRITWTAPVSTDTAGYQVFAAPAGGADPDGPTHVTGTSFHDDLAETGAETVYRVQAVDHYGNLSPSAEVRVTRPAPAALPAPEIDRARPGDLGNQISFGPVGPEATGYRLYRRTDSTSAWTVADTTGADAYEGIDRGAPLGRSFYYVVALDAQGAEGPPSATAEVRRDRPVLTAPLSAPKLTVVQDVRIAVKVDVKPADADRGKGVAGYEWSFSCTNGVWQWSAGETVRIEKSIGTAGPCTLMVRAIGHYGSEGDIASHDFFWLR
ncbi:fibronectin type III domain-containing protein [Streptomyces sp. NPDC101490]|uniref:fibronectin type III domain-containing protein n=1 Tax=Streptomyces sp. NPDC101490 TaxID=3366143 RepID=UPI0038206655